MITEVGEIMLDFYLVLILFIIIFQIIGFILARAYMFRPEIEPAPVKMEYQLDKKRIVDHMVGMIQYKTVSYTDEAKIDWVEFENFQKYLETSYPNIHKVCKKERIGKTGILYH